MPRDALDGVAARAFMVPLLPCADVDEMARFWSALGLRTTYRQLRPNPCVALQRGGIALQYYGMPDWNPELSHSTCVLVVPDTQPVHDAFDAGLRELFGRRPLTGAPRMTRPRARANNGGSSGFSLIDPAGNWIRVTRAPTAADDLSSGDGESTTWASSASGRLGRAVENAVVVADSHGDAEQGRKVLAGALRRGEGEPVPERAAALAYLVELHVRCHDLGAAAAARLALDALPTAGLDAAGLATLATARGEAAAVIAEA